MKSKDKDMKEIVSHMEMLHAPEGFSQRVMNQVLAEPRYSKIVTRPLINPVSGILVFSLFALVTGLVLYFSGPVSAEGSRFFGLTYSLSPVSEWLREVFEPFRMINISPLIIYISFLMIFLLIIVDEFILKRIFQKR